MKHGTWERCCATPMGMLAPVTAPTCLRVVRLRAELLNETSFRSLAQVRALLAEWQDDFNQNRPHTSLKGLTPNEFATRSIQDHNRNGLSL